MRQLEKTNSKMVGLNMIVLITKTPQLKGRDWKIGLKNQGTHLCAAYKKCT